MRKKFEYRKSVTYDADFEVDDLYNATIRATDDYGFSKFMLIRTIAGSCHILKFGPLDDEDHIGTVFSYTYLKAQSSDKMLCKEIRDFLNPKDGNLFDVQNISEEEALALTPDLRRYWQEQTRSM